MPIPKRGMSERSVPSSTTWRERKATQTRTQNSATSMPTCTAVTLRAQRCVSLRRKLPVERRLSNDLPWCQTPRPRETREDAPSQRQTTLLQQRRVVRQLQSLHDRVHEEEDGHLDASDGGGAADRGGCEGETDEDGDAALRKSGGQQRFGVV